MWRGGGSPAMFPSSACAWLCLRPATVAGLRTPALQSTANKEVIRFPVRTSLLNGWWLEGLCRCFPGSSLLAGARDVLVTRRLRVRRAAGASRALLWRDAGSTALVMAGAYAFVLAFDVLTRRNLVDQKLSRKIVHVLSGILFMISWPLFSSSMEARFFAAIVPFANCLRLTVYGLSLATDEGLIKSVTRDGKPEELLRGPLYYVLVLMFCSIIFWRDSPVGVVSLAMMSGGDGMADIMGRRFGAAKLPYNNQKSWVGSISMLIFGFFISMGMLYYFLSLGFIHIDWGQAAEKVALVSLVATLVESLPITDVLDDNVSVPLSSMLMASVLFGYGAR